MKLWTPDHNLEGGPYKVLIKRDEFVDHARDGRVVPFKLYYPVEHGLEKMPVIIWSHGFGGSRDGAAFISRYVAAHGYVIIHITHHGTDSSLWEGQKGHPWDILREIKISRETTLHRMYDVPFVLDQLPGWAQDNPNPGQYMDFKHIGMSGHSFGAMTTMVMAGMLFPDTKHELHSLRDERIKAGILYSPTPISHLTDAPSSEVYAPVSIPLFHMTGTEDHSPLARHGFEERLDIHKHVTHPDQYVKILEGGDHMVYNGTRGKLADNPNREKHEDAIKAASLAFWDAYLKEDKAAKEWLREKWGQKNAG